MSVPGTLEVVNVLEADPDLAAGLDRSAARSLRREAIAPVVRLQPGPWEPSCEDFPPDRTLGLLVLDGLVTREAWLGMASGIEVLGQGDLLRPCHADDEGAILQQRAEWAVGQTTRMAVLDHRFAALMGRYPRIASVLLGRAVRRSRSLERQLALSHLTRVDARLHLLLWHLADRFGRVAPEGVTIPLRLTHEMLGRLVGARRPSVTTAMSDLARRGLLSAPRGGHVTLHGDPPALPSAGRVPALTPRTAPGLDGLAAPANEVTRLPSPVGPEGDGAGVANGTAAPVPR